MNLTEIKLPKALVCPGCEKPISNASPTRSAPHPTFQKGMIIICSNCTSVLIVGDSSLQLARPEQINALSKASQAAILQSRAVLQRILAKKPKSGSGTF